MRKITKERRENGITLIALVVTIVVLIILAAISINAVLGENGIIRKTKETRKIQSHAEVTDATKLLYLDYELEQIIGPSVATGATNTETFLEYLIRKGYTNENGVVVVEKLLGNNTGYGNGSGNSDIYKIEETEDGKYELNYYDVEENKEKLTELGEIKEAEADSNKIIDVIYVENTEKMYVLTQSGEVKCLTGANGIPPSVTSWKIENEVTISENSVKERGDGYFIDNTGKLYIWGNWANYITGSYGLVCVNDIKNSVLNGKNVVKVCDSFVIDSEGKVYAWGRNNHGELGNGTTEDVTIPTCISDIENSALNGKVIIDIQSEAGGSTFAIDNEGKVYSWGAENTSGQLGNGTTNKNYIPICISDLEDHIFNNKKISQIDFGGIYGSTNGIPFNNEYVAFIDDQGKVYTCGYNRYGELGNGNKVMSSVPICISDIVESSLYGKKIIEVNMSAGNAIDENGNIHYWGSEQLLPICKVNVEESTLEYKNIVQKLEYSVDSSGCNVLVLDNKGKIYTASEDGTVICMNDTEGSALSGKNIVHIEGEMFYGESSGQALDDQGKVYTWGDNEYGQLGNGTTESSDTPICISNISKNILNGKNIKSVLGRYSIYALDNEGKVYAWGRNSDGQLGNGTTENITMPICINDIENSGLKDKKIAKIIEIDGYPQGTIFLTEEGELFYSAYFMEG